MPSLLPIRIKKPGLGQVLRVAIWGAVIGSAGILIYGLALKPSTLVAFKDSYPRPDLLFPNIMLLFKLEGTFYDIARAIFIFYPCFALTVYVGSRTLKSILKNSQLPFNIECYSVSFALGLAMMSTFFSLIGMMGLLHYWIGTLLYIGGWLAVLPASKLIWGAFHSFVMPDYGLADGPVLTILKTAVIVWVIILLIGCLHLSINPDVLGYHWANATNYINDGKIIAYPYNIFSFFPQNAEMIYLWQFLLNSELSARLFNFAVTLTLVLLAAGFVQRILEARLGPRRASWAAWFTLALLIFTPMITWQSGTPKNDMMLALFSALAIYFTASALSKSNEEQFLGNAAAPSTAQNIFLAGLFAGAAMGSKYTAAPQVAVLFGLILIHFLIIIKQPFSKVFITLAIFVSGTFFFSASWYVRNIILTHNPVYPFGDSYFPTKFHAEWHPEIAERYLHYSKVRGTITRRGDYFKKIMGSGIQSNTQGSLSPLFVLLTPVLFLVIAKKNHFFRYVFLASILPILFTGVNLMVLRMFTGQVCVIASLMGIGIGLLIYRDKFAKMAVSLAAIALLLNPANLWSYTNISAGLFIFLNGVDPIEVNLRSRGDKVIVNEIEYLRRVANKNLPPEARILFVGENRTALFMRKFYAGSGFDRPVAKDWSAKSGSPEELAGKLKENGITHLLVVPSGFSQTDPAYSNLMEFMVNNCQILYQSRRKNAFIFSITKQNS